MLRGHFIDIVGLVEDDQIMGRNELDILVTSVGFEPSVGKVEVMIDGLSGEQRAGLADENGQLIVSCEFCKTERRFDLGAM